jgi:cytochrome c oxidase subunit II
MLTFFEYVLLAGLIAIAIVVSRWIGNQAYAWMPPQATAEAGRVDELFSFLVSLGAFVFIGVVGVIIFSILFYRAPPGDYSEGHPARGSVKIEILWTIVPVGLVLWLAWQSYNIYEQISILGLTPIVHLHVPVEESAYAETIDNHSKLAAEQIEVVAKQWSWSFRYPNNITSKELHLVVDRSVRLVLHSQDVLHGFYVPEFRVKQDIIPSRTITFVLTSTRTGKYQLWDSQFSGTNFALMNADVYVESPQTYDRWLDRIAQNPANKSDRTFAEAAQPAKTIFNSGWKTISPDRYNEKEPA